MLAMILTVPPSSCRDYDMRILDKNGGPSIPGDANGGAGGGEKTAPPVRLCRFSHDGRQLAVVYDCGRASCPNEVGRNCANMSHMRTRHDSWWYTIYI